jgi:hypothetical protein
MRVYKILEEKRPSENFKRWVPMVRCTTPNANMIVADDSLLCWKTLPYGNKMISAGYTRTKKEAEDLIDSYEARMQELDGQCIVDQSIYKPKKPRKTKKGKK